MKKPVRKTVKSAPAKRTKLDKAAVDICQTVYGRSGSCVCAGSKKPVCTNMLAAARKAARVFVGDEIIDAVIKEPA
ncbi:hypothetical protein Rpal_3392 [Rhodopseudomonas palustris TIE-1]|uniref:hypothetical protein n=1 Tax=Rhodopseudomonas palustris TaxID=1076 RepID=UPI000177977E|nr:hypothetical protein [Rhodopseudomonas palustris]ACF01894.1 hypothetical protein Rpal_3392 [Rhodopseudomonas palustris TIE-1]